MTPSPIQPDTDSSQTDAESVEHIAKCLAAAASGRDDFKGWLGEKASTMLRALLADRSRLSAELEAMRKLIASIRKVAKREQFECGMLLSNPPQNPAAYYIGAMIDDSAISQGDSVTVGKRVEAMAEDLLSRMQAGKQES